MVIPQRFSPRAFWPQARLVGATWFSAGPTLHQMILDRIDDEGPPRWPVQLERALFGLARRSHREEVVDGLCRQRVAVPVPHQRDRPCVAEDRFAPLVVADPDGVLNLADKDFAVADTARARRAGNGLDPHCGRRRL